MRYARGPPLAAWHALRTWPASCCVACVTNVARLLLRASHASLPWRLQERLSVREPTYFEKLLHIPPEMAYNTNTSLFLQDAAGRFRRNRRAI